jgi:uncharacterized membrane protein
MESKAKIFGHAIHPILVVYPLGLLSTAVVFDVIYLITGNTLWTTVSFWMIAAGIVGGLMAAFFGLIDFLGIPRQTRARKIGLIHGLVNLATLILFAVSWLLRQGLPEPSVQALALSFVGVLVASLGGWLGGELVERLGVSVSPGANLNAPNSLTHEQVSDVAGRERVRHA